jgi:hypothetical protein
MTILRSLALSFALVLSAAACGSSSKAGAGQTTTSAANAGVTALAAKIGVSESVVSGALDAAKKALGAGENKTDAEKAAAAQAGVDKAQADATAAGKPLTDDQKSGLLEGLKGML